jgi:acetate kinase
MRILTLRPGPHQLRAALFSIDREAPRWTHRTPREQAESWLREARATTDVDAIALRVAHGADVLRAPAVASDPLLDALAGAAAFAPLHIPAAVDAARACRKAFGGVPVVLEPETGFFAALPLREQLYGLDRDIAVRRIGFHGLMHQAACELAARGSDALPGRRPRRVLSVYLDRRPEVAAVSGSKPVMVTGGATPLEGIPGETCSGELDPGIVLLLMKKTDLGPEQIDALLTRKSGVRGLVGRPAMLGDVLAHASTDQERLARDVIAYRILVACGAGIAALGGVDALVFSGTYQAAGRALEIGLKAKIGRALSSEAEMQIQYLQKSLDRILAETAAAVLSALTQAA